MFIPTLLLLFIIKLRFPKEKKYIYISLIKIHVPNLTRKEQNNHSQQTLIARFLARRIFINLIHFRNSSQDGKHSPKAPDEVILHSGKYILQKVRIWELHDNLVNMERLWVRTVLILKCEKKLCIASI